MPSNKKFHQTQACLFSLQVIVFALLNVQKLIPQAGRLGNIGDGFGGHHEYCNYIQFMHAKAKKQVALRSFSLFRSNWHAQLIWSSSLGIPRYALGCITLGAYAFIPLFGELAGRCVRDKLHAQSADHEGLVLAQHSAFGAAYSTSNRSLVLRWLLTFRVSGDTRIHMVQAETHCCA